MLYTQSFQDENKIKPITKVFLRIRLYRKINKVQVFIYHTELQIIMRNNLL